MKIDLKGFTHKINENVPEQYRNIVWSVIIMSVLIIVSQIISKLNQIR